MDIEKRKKQHMIIMGLIGVIFGMTIGYSALNSLLNINGTSEITSDWDIHFESIEEGTMVGATTIEATTDKGTTATFNVDLEKPGSSATYTVTVKNDGQIDAILESIEGLDTSNTADPTDIKYSIENINTNEDLLASGQKTFTVMVDYAHNPSSLEAILSSIKKYVKELI